MPKKIPQRMCVVCRQMIDKTNLIRVVKNSEGEIEVDSTGKKNGRGAYVCKSCVEKCKDKKLLNRAFKTQVPDIVYSELEDYAKLN